jgi:hypothetical protein
MCRKKDRRGMREGRFADMIATQAPCDNYYLKFDMQRRKPWNTWKMMIIGVFAIV